MSNLIPGNQKHLSLEDRIYIEKSLNDNKSFKDIARFLCKDPSTISKEIKGHRLSEYLSTKGYFSNERNHCIHRFTCKLTNVCNKIFTCDIKCASCPTCNQTCKQYEKERCSRLDGIVTPLIENGQSPYEIICSHPELDISVRTLYTYIDKGILCSRNGNLKRKVKFKARKCHKTQINDRGIFENRMYSDFLNVGLDRWVEMNTVHSCRGYSRVLLTLFFTREKLFLAYILDRCTPCSARYFQKEPTSASLPSGM